MGLPDVDKFISSAGQGVDWVVVQSFSVSIMWWVVSEPGFLDAEIAGQRLSQMAGAPGQMSPGTPASRHSGTAFYSFQDFLRKSGDGVVAYSGLY